MIAPAKTLFRWVDDRTGIAELVVRLFAGQVERHGAWLRTTGLVCVVLVLVECITGPILGLYYTPQPSQAYDDIIAITANPMGRFLRGLHHFSSAALIILAGITIARMFFSHDYKRRHDFIWIVTIIFAQLVLFFQLTGHLLPWDTNAASTANVEAGFAGNVWVIGPFIKRFILGGSAVGGVTLTRWYGFHTMLFPIVLLLLVGLPLLAYRYRHSETGEDPQGPEPGEILSDGQQAKAVQIENSDPYFPVHMCREMVVALAIFLAVAGLAWFSKTPLELEATADNLAGYEAYSEWYVLPLHALTLLPPFNNVTFEPIATMIIPGVVVVALISLPFLYRMRSRPVFHRPVIPLIGSVLIFSIAGLYLFAFIRERPRAAKQMERIAILRGEKQIILDTTLVARGKKDYAENGCSGCHAISKSGGTTGPDLTRAGLLHPDRDWQIQHLIKPDSKVPGSTMPPYGHLQRSEINALAEYMLSLR